ncbi:Nonribosomal peptide synthetase-like protein [Hapsidospora chrysogenum ATCC 11550]|uniref:Nonribosomal peptide synthetase-like protein n=1 Tax=Hapsidospora chrysogenum (strain ATCC 11550 / CBS 779.69 / DSM 880 / IAM 14645 / JCM 23072 / IMI 49137) TaxID=857340 RepID=A0A086T3W5_HAPC1|nr:Nonribosomal peptide synthetase-like protein [Hapsidospora chrysogenum ATCC 11550]
MGAGLYRHSVSFRKILEGLESALEGAPLGPAWSLTEELLQRDDPTRLLSAELSQPLCTALQVALVDLLHQSGITFDAVVGHSSGEIGAAYAAGVIGARDAILIAYYRGYHCHRSKENTRKAGKMMAASMTPEDAKEFCRDARFEGRICVAAENSPSNVTLSGDADAISEAKAALDEKKVFARVLHVDMAYHSHHMQPVREKYLASLRDATISPRRRSFGGACRWYSSVYGPDDDRSRMDASIPFEDTYWADNLNSPVLFSRALTTALRAETFDLALEVGPHPALRAPATETMRDALNGGSLPYHGVLRRNDDDAKAFSDALGFLWATIDSPTPLVDFAGFRRACEGRDRALPRVLKGLPSYPWDHDKPLLRESRKSRDWRTRSTPKHPLLGWPTVIGGDTVRSQVWWRNVLRVDDVEWLQGHKFQNQVLLPAAAYLVMAVDAARHLVQSGNEPVEMIELQDVTIHNGVTLDEVSPASDIDFSIRLTEKTSTGAVAEFHCHCSNADTVSPSFDKEAFSGQVWIKFGFPAEDCLPSRTAPVLSMTDVDTSRFYGWMREVGLDYSTPFVLETIKRRPNFATVTANQVAAARDFTCHPGTLDSIIQSMFAAFSYPGDGRLWTTYLPKSFRSIRFSLHEAPGPSTSPLVADCYLVGSSARSMEGDIHVYATEKGHAQIQMEGVRLTSIEVPSPANDKTLFYKTVWKGEFLSAIDSSTEMTLAGPPSAEHVRLHETCEKTALHYLGQLCDAVDRGDYVPTQPQAQRLVDWARGHVRRAGHLQGLAPPSPRAAQEGEGHIDLEIIHHLGSNLHSILMGDSTPTNTGGVFPDSMLERLCAEGLGTAQARAHLGALLECLVHQYPRMRVLEAGAGAGATTSVALEHIGSKLEDYTFTDPLPSHMQAAQARFAKHDATMKYQTLDLEHPPEEQGFKAHSYDLVIATHALHASSSPSRTIQHCRQLLRPGGFLVLVEPTSLSSARIPFLSAGMAQSWLHREHASGSGPALTEAQWDQVLRDHDFSGVDRAFRDVEDDAVHSFSVMVSQATDDRVNILRDPLSEGQGATVVDNLFIIGGHDLAVAKVANKVRSLLSPFAKNVQILNAIEDVLDSDLPYGSAVVNLSCLEKAVFARVDRRRVEAIQRLFREAKHILWATQGGRAEDPHANIIVGIGRSVSREMSHLRLKFVDVGRFRPSKHSPEATVFSEMFLQMVHLAQPGYEDVLWSNENEVALEDGVTMIPRVMPDNDQNDSLNSTRRLVNRLVPWSSTDDVRLVVSGKSISPEEMPSPCREENSQRFHVLSSSLMRFTCSDDDRPFYLSLGHLSGTNRRALAMTETSGSAVTVNGDELLDCDGGDNNTDSLLTAILVTALSANTLSGIRGTVWVHNASESAAVLLRDVAAHHEGVRLMLTTSDRASRMVTAGEATYIHPYTTGRDLRALMPIDVAKFIDMGPEPDALGGKVASLTGCELDSHFNTVGVSSIIPLSYSRANLRTIVGNVRRGTEDLAPSFVVKADRVHELPDTAVASATVSWTDIQDEVAVTATPASSQPLFGDQKTYFLVGLTGEVGFSLCNWMVDHGARYIAIASRRPAVPAEVLSQLESKGATVRVFQVDLTDMASLQAAKDETASCMPPVAGVVNAAMVVRDRSFDSMEVDDIKATFAPKVDGSKNLDTLFYNTPLDFFVLFSSVVGVVGVPAHPNYAATCLFMSSLAAQRRQRGLAASAMHFGMLLGFGFMHDQAGATTEARFRQDDLMAIPEPDLHEIFAQAILSGRPGAASGSDVIAGLGSEVDTPWRALPRFSHCRFKDEQSAADDGRGEKTRSIKEELEAASDPRMALSALLSAISGRISLALGSRGMEIGDDVGLVTLGVDSLVAIEVRSWLMKVLDVDVPILQFLNGSSLLDICHYVLAKLPSSLLPGGEPEKVDPGENEQQHNNDKRPAEAKKADHSVTSSKSGHMNHVGEKQKAPTDKTLPSDRHDASETSAPPPAASYTRVGAMSEAQAQLYFLREYLGNNAHNIAYYGSYRGRLDMARLRNALWIVGSRHEALRSAYFMDTSTSSPVQAVMSEPRILLEHRDASDSGEMQRVVDAVKDVRFDIEQGVVMKITVLSHSPSLFSIIFNHHHIALDGAGWAIFIDELSQAYAGRISRSSATSPIIQSIDLVRRHGDAAEKARHQSSVDLAFWKETLRNTPEPLPLFSFAKVKSRPATKDYRINTANAKLSGEVTRLIDKAASRVGVTPFQFYLASLATFLARCLGIDDVCIGIVDANRRSADEMHTMGYFLNMVPVRIMLEQSASFDAVARSCRDAALNASAHQSTSFDTILDALEISRSTPHHPLFQVAINHRRAALNNTAFGTDGEIEWEGGVPGGNPYDIFLNVYASSNWTIVQFITQSSLYDQSDSELLLSWYTRALEALAHDSSREIRLCPLANESDIAEAVRLGRGPETRVPWAGTLVDRIVEISKGMSRDVAVKDDLGRTLTYGQMMAVVNEIMRRLRTVSPRLDPDSRVAVLLDPGVEAVCCILAVLRLGLVWVPLDPLNHKRRLQAVVKESRPRVLLCHEATKALAKEVSTGADGTTLLPLGDVGNNHAIGDEDLAPGPDMAGRLQDPALIIYTSGSTGVPKGVVLTHEGLTNQIFGTSTTLDLGRETTLQQSPLGFDLMIDQIFLALCNGGTVAVVGRSGRGDPTHIAELMVKHSVSLTHFVPSEYLVLLNYGHHILKKASSWRYALSGGEYLGEEVRKAFQKLGLKTLDLVNVYGPAEISVACAKGIVPYSETTSTASDYLRPSPNYDIQVCDEQMDVLPVGFPGEICISGCGVGLGYLDRPEETTRKFVTRADPTNPAKSLRTYRSGDKGRILPDGTLQVLGRLDGDSQVKIRGFRVELDEIANALVHMSNGIIMNAAASWRPGQSSGGGLLVAFVVFDAGYVGDKSSYIEWLASNFPLPPVMKPSHIIPTNRIPATPNGKIDRRAVDALELPGSADATAEATVVQDELSSPEERAMRDLWEEVLLANSAEEKRQRQPIGPASDFFQVGGNSILMVKLRSLIEVHFGLKIPLPVLFQASTLDGMAAHLGSASEGDEQDADGPVAESSSFVANKAGRQTVNWDLELAGLMDGLPQPNPASSSPSQRSAADSQPNGLIVVLTGATGFIGRHLLSALTQDARIAQVHCIAIRPDKHGNPRHVSVKSGKIREYTGQLTDLSLGLSDDEMAWLAENADAIIHNGAEVSLLKSYPTLRRANVVSTRTLCAMAIPRRIPVHFVSTAAVAKVMASGAPLAEVSPSAADRELLNSADGYAASKWASETLMERLAETHGLPAVVHRLAHVVGEDASELDAVGMFTKYSLLMHKMPRISSDDVVGMWDFIPVEDVSRDMLQSVMDSVRAAGPRAAAFINHCSDVKVPHEQLQGYLERKTGAPLEVLEMKDWLRYARAAGMHPLVHEFFTVFDEGRGKLVLPVIAKGTA